MKEMKLWKCECGAIIYSDLEKSVPEDRCPDCGVARLYWKPCTTHKLVEEKCHRCGSEKYLVYVSCCGKLACLNCVVDFGDSFICRECGKDFVTKEVKLVEVEITQAKSDEKIFLTTLPKIGNDWIKEEFLKHQNLNEKNYRSYVMGEYPKQPSEVEQDLAPALNLDSEVTAAKSEQPLAADEWRDKNIALLINNVRELQARVKTLERRHQLGREYTEFVIAENKRTIEKGKMMLERTNDKLIEYYKADTKLERGQG